jgi:pSer/pThr/pTyr-binding forkhead associated (FHA) protein
MRVSLTLAVRGEMEGHKIPITIPDFVIGRDPHCHLCPNSPMVGACHCVLQVREEDVFLQNLDTTIGTFVNERQIAGGIQLCDGDRLRIGPLVFEVNIESAAPRAKTVSMLLNERPHAAPPEDAGKAKEIGQGPVVGEDPLARKVVNPRKSASYYLIVANGNSRGMPIPISADLFMIGNDKMCQLRPQLAEIGDRHCALVTRDGKVFVRDLSSGYPTLLKGDLIAPGEEWPAHTGDRIGVGPLELLIQYREKPLWGRDLEEWGAKCLDVSSQRELFDEDADAFHHATTASEAAAKIIDKLQAQRGLVMGRLRIGRQAGITIVRFNDRHLIDEGEIAMIKNQLCENLARSNLRVLLDCKNVTRMSTGAIKMLDQFRGWLGPWGSTLAICRIRPGLLQTMCSVAPSLAGIPRFPDKRAALSARW